MPKDEERDIVGPPRPDAHASLAGFITGYGDHSAAIYRHYNDLAARDLLYLQSELAELKSLQDEHDREDFKPGQIDAKERARDWKMFKRLAETPGNKKEKQRMELMLKIRSTLRDYSMLKSLNRLR